MSKLSELSDRSSRSGAYTAQPDRFVHDRLPAREHWPQMRYELPELQLPDRLNLVEELLDKATERGWADRPMLQAPGVCLSYAQARERVDAAARVLVEHFALVPGNRVLLRGGNSVGMALAWLSVVKAGMVAVATMPLLRAGELRKVIDKAQPALALCDATMAAELDQAVAGGALLFEVIHFDASGDGAALGALCVERQGPFAACPTAADDIALLAFTSGTTGTPKAPMHSHRDVIAACNAWPRHVLQCGPQEVVIGSPPLAFTFGLGGLLLFPMAAGASVYFPQGSLSPDAMIEEIKRSGATVLFTAPTLYRKMAPIARKVGIGALRICVSAGEALPDATRRLWRDATHIEIIDGIGATEMFHIFISTTPGDQRDGAIGKAVPGYTARVVNDQGAEVPRGTVGRLAVIGPTGCRYMDDERQSNYVVDGWNHPGDAFMQDADGYFHFQARDDDMIITAGYNVAGPEVEDALLSHPAVAECGVIGAPDAERGMVVKAFCVLKPGHEGNADMTRALQEHVKATIAPFKYPRVIDYRAALPRTETGKLQRFRLKQEGN